MVLNSLLFADTLECGSASEERGVPEGTRAVSLYRPVGAFVSASPLYTS